MNTIVTISVLLSVAAYSVLFVFCLVNWIRGVTGQALLLASSLSLIWVCAPVFSFSQAFYTALEPVAVAGWLVLLIRALGTPLKGAAAHGLQPVVWTFLTAILLAAIAFVTSTLALLGIVGLGATLPIHLAMVVVNVLGLVLVEQLAQNSVSDYRWRVRYLNIGLGMMFGFGLVHHALTILFEGPALIMAVLQPAVMALIVPFVIIASLRNRTNKLRFSLSRNFVFRTGVLVATGSFLLALGLFGYLAQIFAGEVGITIAVFISIVSLAIALVVVGSSRFRSQIRVLLAKTFFEYRYDYRDEWMKVTAQLTEPDADFDLPQQAQRAILSILHARKACLWLRDEQGVFRPLSSIEASDWQSVLPVTLGEAIADFYTDLDWVLDLNNMPESAGEIAAAIAGFDAGSKPAFLVPMFVETRLSGVCLVGPAEIPVSLSWEDYDIIKLISKQCAAFLALQEANQSLIEHEQLTAVNQMSAFLLHDIKTIAAQLSLMLENATKHKDNPEFIDDMLATTRNSVQRMERIISGLREPQAAAPVDISSFDLLEFLQLRAADNARQQRSLTYQLPDDPVHAGADAEALETALTHLEQNALDAVGNDGSVTVKLEQDQFWAFVKVIDDGPGMEPAFVRHELFTPFRSTKGLTGMGIGAYQARDKIRSVGGDLQVDSKVGVGTTFTIKLPLAE